MACKIRTGIAQRIVKCGPCLKGQCTIFGGEMKARIIPDNGYYLILDGPESFSDDGKLAPKWGQCCFALPCLFLVSFQPRKWIRMRLKEALRYLFPLSTADVLRCDCHRQSTYFDSLRDAPLLKNSSGPLFVQRKQCFGDRLLKHPTTTGFHASVRTGVEAQSPLAF